MPGASAYCGSRLVRANRRFRDGKAHRYYGVWWRTFASAAKRPGGAASGTASGRDQQQAAPVNVPIHAAAPQSTTGVGPNPTAVTGAPDAQTPHLNRPDGHLSVDVFQCRPGTHDNLHQYLTRVMAPSCKSRDSVAGDRTLCLYNPWLPEPAKQKIFT